MLINRYHLELLCISTLNTVCGFKLEAGTHLVNTASGQTVVQVLTAMICWIHDIVLYAVLDEQLLDESNFSAR